MIEELFAWSRLDCLPAARRLGFRSEAAALQTRHRRLRSHWAPHLAHTRAALLESARAAAASPEPPSRAWIMGAGLLHDVPLPELLRQFERIDLVDVAFSPAARAAARRHPGRVVCTPLDVTGVLDDLSADPARAAPAMPAQAWCASVNLLSQLPLLPGAALRKRGTDEQRIGQFARALQQTHVNALQRAAHACLLIEYAQTDPASGREVEVLLPAWPARLTDSGWRQIGQWQWLLNPAGETVQPQARAMQAWHR
jgi:hypothetical protein